MIQFYDKMIIALRDTDPQREAFKTLWNQYQKREDEKTVKIGKEQEELKKKNSKSKVRIAISFFVGGAVVSFLCAIGIMLEMGAR